MAASVSSLRALAARPLPRPPCTSTLSLHAVCRVSALSAVFRVPTDRWHDRRGFVPHAAAVEASAPVEQPQQEPAATQDLPFFGLPLPAVRHHPTPKNFKDIKVFRAQCNTAARDKTLVNMLIGEKGITQTFLSACMDVLMKRQFLRLKLGPGCTLERGETAEALEQLLDCICVHQIGYTISFYRQPGLPRPSNCPTTFGETDAGEQAAAAGGAGSGDAAGGGEVQAPVGRKSTKRKVRGPRAPRERKPSGPEEFQVVA